MKLEAGRTIGHYRIIEKIGEGGMGEVWRARDTTLDRDVAIKTVPEALAAEPDSLARFEREAKLLASLSHPGIATIHGFHEAEGVRFLAMELVPGEDLSRRLARGPIPVDEALGIALKVAEALEAAHEHGVVHRDLKPANIQIAPDGTVKILDFGLAKALDPDPGGTGGSGSASLSPTMTTPATRAGVILGTAAYMSPEQAKGKPVDRRADIWGFGCVLHEMLTGRRTFVGDGVSEVMAAVIMSPVDIGGLPSAVPPRVQRLLRRCLEKDPRRRLRDIGEARYLLEEVLSGTADEEGDAAGTGAPAHRPPRRMALALVAAVAVSALATAALVRVLSPGAPAPPVRRFELPASGPFRSGVLGPLVAVSPDGRSVAYMDDGQLLVRRLARLEPVVIPTQGEPGLIFWSPDSAFIGYAAGGKLWKAPAGGGQSTAITDAPGGLTGGAGAAWCPDGRIYMTLGGGGLYQVPALGGDFQEIFAIDSEKETDFHQPGCLPDGNGVLLVAHTIRGRPDTLFVYADGQRSDLLKIPGQDFWFPVYSRTGHILYRRQPANAGIWALPFSLESHEVTGKAILVAADGDVPSVSADGTLVHTKGASSRITQLVWVERSGKILGPIGQPQEQWPFPELSPDGRYIAIQAQENEVRDVWIHDVERGTRTRLSANAGNLTFVSWSNDGERIIYDEGGTSFVKINTKSADGSGEPLEIGEGVTASFSSDDRYILFTQQVGTDSSNWNIRYIDTDGDDKPVHLLPAEGIQMWPRLSPDGRHFAYVSDESGSDEVYIKRFPSAKGKWQVSLSGGYWPKWSRSGDRLYYIEDETIMEVDVTTTPALRLGTPRAVFTRRPLGWPLTFGWPAGFDVSADGERFIISQPLGDTEDTSGIVVLENWLGEFEGRQ